MEVVDTGYFKYIHPKMDEQGITFVYDVRLEKLSLEIQVEKIKEIRALNMPVWWGLLISNELFAKRSLSLFR